MNMICRWSVLVCAMGCLAPLRVAHGDGQRDFDFSVGTFATHVSRLAKPLSGSKQQLEYDGVSVVSEVWGGRANLLELDVQGPSGRIQGVGLRLYNPKSQQWSLNWANGDDGVMTPPMRGEFRDGRGDFFDHEMFGGRGILVHNSFTEITKKSSRFEQAFSADGGRTWEPNWVMKFQRSRKGAHATKAPANAAVPGNVSHDFDFDFGTWTLRGSRLQKPLTGSISWEDFEGRVVVRKIWNGRANLAEVTVKGKAGVTEILSLRLYNPETKQWRMHFAQAESGVLGPPMIGEFKDGRGQFYSIEPYGDRTILVRFVFVPLTADSARSEQAFSEDGGKTWEVNWVNNYSRTR